MAPLPLSLVVVRRASEVLHGYDRVVAALDYWIINRSINCEFFVQVHSRTLHPMANSEVLIFLTPDLHN